MSFTSVSEGFLKGLRNSLSLKGVKGGGLFALKDSNCYRLTFSVRDALKI